MMIIIINVLFCLEGRSSTLQRRESRLKKMKRRVSESFMRKGTFLFIVSSIRGIIITFFRYITVAAQTKYTGMLRYILLLVYVRKPG